MPTIRLDDDVFNGLKSLAEPFTDTPNSVIRRLLEERGALSKAQSVSVAAPRSAESATSATAASRRSSGSGLVPQSTYEAYLLHVLATKFKGRGDKREVTKAIIGLLQSQKKLSTADFTHVTTGETRAENTIAWSRNALKERGLISQSSPRGTWELTAQGMKEGLDLKLI